MHIANYLSPGDIAEISGADLVRNTLFGQSLLGLAYHRYLRYRIYAKRQMRGYRAGQPLGAEGVAHGPSSLLHRSGRKGRKADYIAYGVYMGDNSLVAFVDSYKTVGHLPDADSGEVESVGVPGAPHRVEEFFRDNDLAALKVGDHPFRLLHHDIYDLLAEAERDPRVAHPVHQARNYLRVGKRQ